MWGGGCLLTAIAIQLIQAYPFPCCTELEGSCSYFPRRTLSIWLGGRIQLLFGWYASLNVFNILSHFNILIEMPNSNTYISYICKIAFIFISGYVPITSLCFYYLILQSIISYSGLYIDTEIINNITCMQYIELIHVIKVLLNQKQYLWF